MKIRRTVIAAVLVLLTMSLAAQNVESSWKKTVMDGSRTGCVAPNKENVKEALGYIKGGRYHAPSGRVYGKNTATYRAAKAVIAAQPAMARVKDVIGHASMTMEKDYPESALSNWFIDIVMASVEELSGKKVDIGVGNFGGIRSYIPEGDIILDDMLSMFPFRNQIVYVRHKGSTIRQWLEWMAATRFQVLGGVEVVAEDGKLVSAKIGGEPLQDDKEYGMATISFLLHGGDDLRMADGALEVQPFEVNIIDVILKHVYAETAAGRPICYHEDGRVVIR